VDTVASVIVNSSGSLLLLAHCEELGVTKRRSTDYSTKSYCYWAEFILNYRV